MLVTTNHFEPLARAALGRGGVAAPHLAVGEHPLSGLSDPEVRVKGRALAAGIAEELLGRTAATTEG